MERLKGRTCWETVKYSACPIVNDKMLVPEAEVGLDPTAGSVDLVSAPHWPT